MFDLKAITRLLLLPGVLPVFLIKVISGFPSGQCRPPLPRGVQGLVWPSSGPWAKGSPPPRAPGWALSSPTCP